jgi:tRNA(fMet)-specific endonuclease VapC
MIRFLLDTNIATRYLAAEKSISIRFHAMMRLGHRVGICEPIVGELYFGAERGKQTEKTIRLINRFLSDIPV